MWPNKRARRYLINYFAVEDYDNGFKLFKWYRIVVENGVVVGIRRDTEEREYSLSHKPPPPITADDIDFRSHRTRKEEERHQMQEIAYYWPMKKSFYIKSERRI